ncbi:unnamed protein product [Didymodactylos carnosus]|uniref:SWIM-type domain-containing protein n=1 Tax=Didymodactylos carnosus TaxID=1234261 RepID=A0A816C885_9BILA|nr:unnamed protein product [Didymodactylos carnosus]CAF4507467.1 unnamed protein product [Didymodactylos carnosus]
MGYRTFMPLFLPKTTRKYTTQQANNNRFITALRFVVENVNGRLKQWRFFDKVVQNSSLKFVHGYLSIVASLINAYRPSFINDTSHDEELAKAFFERKDMINDLEKNLEDKDIMKARQWLKYDAAQACPDFPILTEEKLREFTLGVFQVKQARSYTVEHLDLDGEYEIRVRKEDKQLLRVNLQSKHSARKNYHILIKYNDETGTGACCQCSVGSRTVGTCSHATSVIWYLGIARHEPDKYLTTRSSKYLELFEDANHYSSESPDDDNTLYTLAD